MLQLFVNSVLGHFVGDYLLQNQWMAIEKSHPGRKGHVACTIHVLLYTFAVALFSGIWTLPFLLAVAIPHWIIDRWSLAKYILKWKNSYSMEQVWDWKSNPFIIEEQVWKVAFAAPVYIMNDNTLHFVCLWLTAKIFQGH